MQQRWRSKFRALTSSIAFKEHFMGCCFDVRTVLDLAGDALGLFIKMCWGSCCFDLQVHMRVRGGLRLQSHCCGTSLVQKCHHLQVICVSKGLQPWETGKKKKASDGQDCSACAEIYGDVADVFSGTKINRVIYGDWFGFWKLITDGWFFPFFFFFFLLKKKLSNNLSVMEPYCKVSSLFVCWTGQFKSQPLRKWVLHASPCSL